MNKPFAARLEALARQANEMGAEGVWLIRGAKDARLSYGLEAQAAAPNFAGVQSIMNFTLNLDIADTGVLVVIRFPDDGKEPGIEMR